MAVKYNASENNVVVPKLPQIKTPYVPYTSNYTPYNKYNNYVPKPKTDPSAYYAKAMGFLPIDVRYMVNTTNSLAYNSMADVVLNRAAHEARWGDTKYSWLAKPQAQLLRMPVDTFLLIKDTIVDPIAQGVTEDGWQGFKRGSSTALMNTLINFGNTLDILSNPIKGLVLEGWEGAKKGLFGDEHGRKQYDYNEYINTGNKAADLALSFVAEFFSDPLNLASLGTKSIVGAVTKGSKTMAASTITSLKDVVGEAVELGFKNIDEIQTAVKSGLLSTSDNLAWLADDTVEAVFKEAFKDSKTITKEMISQLDNAKPMLQKIIKRAALSKDPSEIARQLKSSKATRLKASYFNKNSPKNAPAYQMLASNYLTAALSDSLPDVLNYTKNKAIKYGAKIYRTSENIERTLRYTAGATGMDELVWSTKGINKGVKHIRNVLAEHDPDVIKTMDDLKKFLDPDGANKAIEALEQNNVAVSKDFVESVYKLYNEYSRHLREADFVTQSADKIKLVQEKLISKIDDLVKELGVDGVTSYSDYIKYLKDANVLEDTAVSGFIKTFEDINKLLNEDFSDKLVRSKYSKAVELIHTQAVKEYKGQADAMDKQTRAVKKWYKKHGVKAAEELEKYGDDTASALRTLTKISEDTGRSILDDLDDVIIPETLDALVKNKQHEGLINSFNNLVEDFRTSLETFKSNSDDIVARDALVQDTQSLIKRLKSFTEFKVTDDITISDASEIYNAIGIPYLGGRTRPDRYVYLDKTIYKPIDNYNTYEESILKEADRITQALRSDLKYKQLYIRLINRVQDDPHYFTKLYGKPIKGAEDGLYGQEEIIKAVEKYLSNEYVDKYYSEYASALGYTPTKLLNMAQKIRTLSTVSLTNEFTLENLSSAIRDLPDLNVQALNNIVSPEYVSKYKLIIYGIMNRQAAVVNLMLGMNADGSAIARGVSHIKVTSTILNTAFDDPRFNEFITYISENNLFDKEYNVFDINDIKNTFIKNLRIQAEELVRNDPMNFTIDILSDEKSFSKFKTLIENSNNVSLKEAFFELQRAYVDPSFDVLTNRIHVRTVIKQFEDAFINYKRNTLDLYHKLKNLEAEDILNDDYDMLNAYAQLFTSEDAYYKAFEKFDEADYNLKTLRENNILNIAEEQKLIQDVEDALSELRTIVKTRIDELFPTSKIENLTDIPSNVYEQAVNFLNLSDEQIGTLAKFDSEEIFSNEKAYLDKLLTEYKNTEGTLYKFLNDPRHAADSIMGSTVVEVKKLIERLQNYKNLVGAISKLTQQEGLPNFYTEGLLDAFVTQLGKQRDINVYNLNNVIDEMLTGAHLYIRNLFDAPSTSMDAILNFTVTSLSKKYNLDPVVKNLIENISARLKSGKAHSAVTDVDNLIDLINLAKYTDDKRLKNLIEKFTQFTAGKRKVVFDIESTDANAAAAHVFQISGKVLNEDGTEVLSTFNYIIKPPPGIKPTHNVLSILSQDADPEQWWIDNIVNAESSATQTVFDNIEDALNAFAKQCSDQGPVVLVGHNIKGYDLPELIKRANNADVKQYLNTVEKFDTLQHMNSNVMFQLTDEQASIFKTELHTILKNALDAQNTALQAKPFQYVDVKTLSDLKRILKTESNKFIGEGFGFEDVGDAGVIERIIDSVVTEWSSPKLNTNKFFVVSKLNAFSVEEQIQTYLKELADTGLVDVMPGRNIMQFLAGGVSTNSIMINPVRAISYEVEDIFDLNKALNVYKIKGLVETANGVMLPKKSLRFQDLAKLTKQAIHIQRIRNWIPSDYIEEVAEDAYNFIKRAEQSQSFLRVLRDNPDNITLVAAAIYAYNLLSDTDPLKQLDAYKHFGNVAEKIASVRGLDNFTRLPILNELDKTTGLPRFIFEDEWYTYDKFADVLKKNLDFDDIRDYYIERNLYNLHEMAKHALLEPVAALSKEINDYLNSLNTASREIATNSIRHYNDALDRAAVTELLTRPNRVDALKSEAFVRGGYVVFATDSKIDLSDFRNDGGFVVVDNLMQNNKKYIHILAAKREVFNAASDITIAPKVMKSVAGIDDNVYNFIKRMRELATEKGVKNLGYSHGDAVTKDIIEDIHDLLRRSGVSEDDINMLPDVDLLNTIVEDAEGNVIRPAFFGTVRANISVIGGHEVWQTVTDNLEYFKITDPFKQIAYTITSAISKNEKDLIYYCSVLLNKHNNIKTSQIFGSLKEKDLYDLLKKNDDFVMVYATKTGYWDHTKSGLIVKEFDLVNANSIKRARDMEGVYILPRTIAAQLMQAVNEFELPPIARFAKAIGDVYKIAYFGAIGFIIRNVIDSNYKTYVSLEGQVSLPKSIMHFTQTLGIVQKHTDVGQEYAKAMGEYFDTDLEYDIFYKYCHSFGDDIALEDIIMSYPEHLHKTVTRQLTRLSDKFNAKLINKLKPKLIQPELFSVVDTFINHGPSAGLSKTILKHLSHSDKPVKNLSDVINKYNEWFTRSTPMKYVYGANDYVEQAARLSMFLQRLELGDSIDEANKAIIRAHFDYSDKTIGMLYTEIVFPFMSFSYKNLNFWVETMYRNPMLVGQMENIFRPILDYQGLFEPDQEAYEAYDYTFDWSKDIATHKSNIPWTYINAARLYHILNGNILIKHGKTVEHDAGYGEKTNDLYTVFKLSPSVLDATRMLYTPLNAYSERLLPPYEALFNLVKGMGENKNVVNQMSITSLANMLPYFDTILQRVGVGPEGLRHNNIIQRVKDAGPHQILGSLFGVAYVPQKDNVYYYDSNYNILGGFKTNYYAKKNYSNPYNSKYNAYSSYPSYNPRYSQYNKYGVYPSYTLTRMAQNKKAKDIYAIPKINRIRTHQYNHLIRGITDRALKYRLKDYNRYY